MLYLLAESSPDFLFHPLRRSQQEIVDIHNEQGLVLQTNLTSGTTRTVRVSPVGPDGAPHFEVLAQESGWKPGLAAWVPVDDAFAQMLAACAAGHGDCHYMGEGGKAFTVMSPLSSPALP